MTARDDVLTLARAAQTRGATELASEPRPLRVILEFDNAPNLGGLERIIRQRLAIEVSASQLFAPVEGGEPVDPALAGFIAVTIPGVRLSAIDGQAFELAYALADATGARSAEPELGTNFFTEPRRSWLEGAIEVPGCWVPDDEDIAEAQPFWALDKIRARRAWDIPPAPGGKARGEGIRIFQPDTGVADHAEIEASMLDLSGAYDFIAGRAGATDPLDYEGNQGHGTETASVVASRVAGRVAGSAPRAKLTPIRAIERVVVFDHGQVAAAVEHARRKGADVITMSLGGAWSSSLRAAIGRAIDQGVVVLAAAGNCVGFVVWPARYEEVVAVAGINVNDQPWRGSCRGEAVDISAPAEFVLRAKRNPNDGGGPNVVAGGQGTSFAVALTAGVAALWLGHHGTAAVRNAVPPGGTVQRLFTSLLRSTSRRPPGFDTSSFGAGIVNSETLLQVSLSGGAAAAGTLEGPEDPYRSIRSLVAETGGRLESAVDIDINYRRFAAELSHLALAKHRQDRTGGLESAEAGSVAVPASPTLRAAIAASGSTALEALVK